MYFQVEWKCTPWLSENVEWKCENVEWKCCFRLIENKSQRAWRNCRLVACPYPIGRMTGVVDGQDDGCVHDEDDCIHLIMLTISRLTWMWPKIHFLSQWKSLHSLSSFLSHRPWKEIFKINVNVHMRWDDRVKLISASNNKMQQKLGSREGPYLAPNPVCALYCNLCESTVDQSMIIFSSKKIKISKPASSLSGVPALPPVVNLRIALLTSSSC